MESEICVGAERFAGCTAGRALAWNNNSRPPVSSEQEIDATFETVKQEQILALVAAADPFLSGSREKNIALAAKYKVPAIYEFCEPKFSKEPSPSICRSSSPTNSNWWST
jgi:hypothetical protein